MAVGFPRSVLSGTARHGANIIRSAILQRRGVVPGRRYGDDEDPYDQAQRRVGYPAAPKLPTAPAPPPPRPVVPTKGYVPPSSTYTAPPRSTFYDNFGGIGGAGGGYTKKGVFDPYSYNQESGGKYAGWNTRTSLNQAVEGRAQSEIDRLNEQVAGYEQAYSAAEGAVKGRAATGRKKAQISAIGAMPTYGTLEPELFESAYQAELGRSGGPLTREVFADMPIGFANRTEGELFNGPQVLGLNGNRRTTLPGRPMGSRGLDVALGGTWGTTTVPGTPPPGIAQTAPYNPSDVFGMGTYTGTTPTLPPAPLLPGGTPPVTYGVPTSTPTENTAPQYRDERLTYDPLNDWAASLGRTGAGRQLGDLQDWEKAQLADLEQQYAPTFADIEQYQSIPRNMWNQNIAVNAYGVDPSLAAGTWDEDWQRDFERGALTDELGMLTTQAGLAKFDENGMPISEPMRPGQIVSETQAQQKIDFFNENGYWPEEGEQAETEYEQAEKARIYGELDAGFGGVDSNAVLQAANLTPEQGYSILQSGEYEAALALLSEALNEEGELDELVADERMRDIRREGGPAVAALMEALFPEMVSENYLVP